MQLLQKFSPIEVLFLINGKTSILTYYKVLVGGLWMRQLVSFYEDSNGEKCIKKSENSSKNKISEIDTLILSLIGSGLKSKDFFLALIKNLPDVEKKYILDKKDFSCYINKGFFSLFSGVLSTEGKKISAEIKVELNKVGLEVQEALKQNKAEEISSKLMELGGFIFVLPSINKELYEVLSNFFKTNSTENNNISSGDDMMWAHYGSFSDVNDAFSVSEFSGDGGGFGSGGSSGDFESSDSGSDSSGGD